MRVDGLADSSDGDAELALIAPRVRVRQAIGGEVAVVLVQEVHLTELACEWRLVFEYVEFACVKLPM